MDTEGEFFSGNMPTSYPGYRCMACFRVQDYFHIYWSKTKILFYACVEERCSASLTIAREKQT